MSQAPLTVEQMRRALQLVVLHGSVSAAARAENLPRQTGLVTTFWDVDEGADYLRYLRRAA